MKEGGENNLQHAEASRCFRVREKSSHAFMHHSFSISSNDEGRAMPFSHQFVGENHASSPRHELADVVFWRTTEAVLC
jgi:hypothetical protein